MKREKVYSVIFTTMVFLFFGGSFCLGESGERHYCEDGNFSFAGPDGWVVLNTDDMSGRNKNKLYRIRKHLSCPGNGWVTTICRPSTGGFPLYKLIFILRSGLGEKSDFEIEADWLLEKYQKRRTKKLYSTDQFVADIGTDIIIEEAGYSYQGDRHTAFETVKGKIDGSDFVRVTATILGSRNKTIIFCHLQDIEDVDAEELVGQIADSFEYDSGYEFGADGVERVGRQARTVRKAKGILIQFFVLSMLLFVGLFLYRIVSGEHLPIVGIIVASVSGALVFSVTGWLVWQVFSADGYGWHSYLPIKVAIVAMIPIVWKWPGSEVSLKKSVIAVCSLWFLLSLIPGIIMAMGAPGGVFIPIILVILVLTLLAWRM